ncbi:uncharacterized protein Z520_10869 [Fonsecaea multimorphosa CBS 102226]|uniref:Uncharacterized protein n=1 Tax=Fonsecaea multimorphosa CBS 102226 TaxID=1442371 RepID=A0A0D2GV76_9EURO|nr:uncharacterized protein Z520_10869 [Fonsecaea multimorphosa CBS 102226]KIX93450.1 hypothetical protein Z520_10869 [Fonsecaea multimorphosa CBS 102226]OAL18747.1 hypothetical protein AYO22_10440 [Fonsecaea multimorphosa]
MYRNSAQLKCIKGIPPNALPSPDNTSDSDSELLDALDQKRRQLDEEVAKFKAAKDREFREFEKQLWVNKKRSRAGANSASEGTPTRASSTTSALNLLASTQNGSVPGRPGYKARRDAGAGDKVRKPAPLSGPTLSLEKLNITGETTPPLHTLGTPPTPTILARARSRSPTSAAARPTTPPPTQLKTDPPLTSTPTPSKDRSDPFAGVFTPMYLPLLESSDRSPIVRSPQPMTSAEEEAKRLQLDAESKERADQVLKQQARSSQSLPPQPVSPTVVATKRAQSTSILPSASLPSALRSTSGGGRRRKHVMFQLADLKVVDPSSSYEEGPSPELEGETDMKGEAQHGGHSLEQHGNQVSDVRDKGSPGLLGAKDRRRGRGRGGRFISPIPSPLASPSPSPTPSPALNGGSPSASPLQSPRLISSPDESGFSGGLVGAADGGSGVGFFELDEELASPALRDGRPAEAFDLEVEDEISEKIGRDPAGAGEKGLGIIPQVQVGSVPIDIVKPSGSWVGSFGH